MDEKVDRLQRDAYRRIKQVMQDATPDLADYLINMLMISRHMERLADHATNIAEEIIYLIDGTIVRHKERSCKSDTPIHQRASNPTEPANPVT